MPKQWWMVCRRCAWRRTIRPTTTPGPVPPPKSGAAALPPNWPDMLAQVLAHDGCFDVLGPPSEVSVLMRAPELVSFSHTDWLARGRLQGSQDTSAQALDRGLLAVVTQFQQTVTAMVQRRLDRIANLQQLMQEQAGFSPATRATLGQACALVQVEIGVLSAQSALAARRRGWVLPALNRYRQGVDSGAQRSGDPA